MSGTNAFVWLSGTVTIPAQAPEAWRRDGLSEFYRNPNHQDWGGALCRVLYHESIHFWQLLSSAYLANGLQDEWLRLLEFEQTGHLRPASELVSGMLERRPGEPFSTLELMECWARYWDVHTRSPATIIEEDQIHVADRALLRTQQGNIEGYTSEAFDLYMQDGKDAEFYAAPYRWMLDQCDGHSAFANIAFPILVFHAFGSPDPIGLLRKSLERALKSELIWQGVRERSRNINLDWLNNWAVFIGEAIEPTRRDLSMPNFTAGWDVIARGRLGAHPIYGQYLGRIRALFRLASLGKAEPPKEESLPAIYAYAVADLPTRDPVCIFAFPGQPEYRLTLGEYVPLPRVRFDGFTLHAERSPGGSAVAKVAAMMGQTMSQEDVTFKPVFDEFDPRLRRFRHAEYAVSVGLPSTTFN
jgi:hypothetical protein